MNQSDAVFAERALDATPANLNASKMFARYGERKVVTVPIVSLLPGDSPRLEGQDAEHVARLAEIEAPLPPILVDRCSMRVIDGMHRLMAAFLKGLATIDVEFFDGSSEDAFLYAVQANVKHGLPLTRADRRAAAMRIIASHPYMSDRAIGLNAGLGARTVANIRRHATGAVQANARVGRDGRIRPLSSAEGRQRAAEVLAEHPQASLREVARLAGIAPSTVSDVRKRLGAGKLPTTERQRAADALSGSSVPARSAKPSIERKARQVQTDPVSILEKLLRDPSLRHKEDGRSLLRLLQQNAMGMQEWSELPSAVPPHCVGLVVDVARKCAETWLQFAQEVDERVRSTEHEEVGG